MLLLSIGLLALAAAGLVLQPIPTAEAQRYGNQVRVGFLTNWVDEVKREVVTSRNYFEAAVYAYGFVHFWHEIAGLPEMPTASTAAALDLAEIVGNIPRETRDAAVSAINAVLQSARCAGVRCY
jgi:hypothetical protein